jgi:hypothetical protein
MPGSARPRSQSARIAAQHSARITHVLPQCVDQLHPTGIAALFLRRIDAAEVAPHRAPRLVAVSALCDERLHLLFEVVLDLVIEIAFDRLTP